MTNQDIYLDNSATTPLSEVVVAKISEVAAIYGNPSSLHRVGQEAEAVLSEAREQLLRGFGLRPRQKTGTVIFTSCGTEATSLALFGTAYAKERREATRILTTDSEHPSVEKALQRLESDGFEVVRIPTKGGVLDMIALEAALDKRILLATMMLVNNETGAVYEIGEAFRRIKERYPSAVTHCDAVQGFMKLPFTPATLHADLITVSGHKLHAPKGVGALYINTELIKAKKIVPFLVGGGQEDGFRSGTENTIGIATFGASVADLGARANDRASHIRELRAYAEEKLGELEVRINRPLGACLPHVINLTLPHIKSETMLHALSADRIYVSSGSACSSHSHHPSTALLAFGLTPQEADCSLRISMSDYTTKEDVDALCESLRRNLDRLVRIK